SSLYSLSLHDALPIYFAHIFPWLSTGCPQIPSGKDAVLTISVWLLLTFIASISCLSFLIRPTKPILLYSFCTFGFWTLAYKDVEDRKSTRLNSSHVSI